MSPVAHALLCAVRYAHGRSLAPHAEVIAAVRILWPTLDERDRRGWLALVEEQVPAHLRRMIETVGDGIVPVSRAEVEGELRDYEALFAWCRSRLGPVAAWPCDACAHRREAMARGDSCDCRCHPPAWPGVTAVARNLAPSAAWVFGVDGCAHVNATGAEEWAWLTVEPSGDVVIVVGGAKWRGYATGPFVREDAEAWLRARAATSMRRAAWARALLAALGWEVTP